VSSDYTPFTKSRGLCSAVEKLHEKKVESGRRVRSDGTSHAPLAAIRGWNSQDSIRHPGLL